METESWLNSMLTDEGLEAEIRRYGFVRSIYRDVAYCVTDHEALAMEVLRRIFYREELITTGGPLMTPSGKRRWGRKERLSCELGNPPAYIQYNPEDMDPTDFLKTTLTIMESDLADKLSGVECLSIMHLGENPYGKQPLHVGNALESMYQKFISNAAWGHRNIEQVLCDVLARTRTCKHASPQALERAYCFTLAYPHCWPWPTFKNQLQDRVRSSQKSLRDHWATALAILLSKRCKGPAYAKKPGLSAMLHEEVRLLTALLQDQEQQHGAAYVHEKLQNLLASLEQTPTSDCRYRTIRRTTFDRPCPDEALDLDLFRRIFVQTYATKAAAQQMPSERKQMPA